jgi:beta-mannosidase
MRNKACLLLILSMLAEALHAQNLNRPLNASWQFRKEGDAGWMRAAVPGTVHTDLLANNKIPDPFYRDNESKLQWIEKENWEYQGYFDLDQKTLDRQNIELVFNGLDTYADVYLNNELILRANNMFRTWTVDVKGLLRQRNNHLFIKFASAQNRVDSMAKSVLPFVLPDNSRVYVRKAQYHFGWDWGPKFTTCGIWRKIDIQAWDDVKVEDVYVKDFVIDTMLRDGQLVTFATVAAEITINSRLDKIYNLALSEAVSPQARKGEVPASYSNERNFVELLERIYVKKGSNRYEVVFGIRNPELWWSAGMGKQKIYQLACDLYDANDMHAASREHFVSRFALRKIELVTVPDARSEFASALQDQTSQAGTTFYLRLNGLPVFIKGANYVPQSPFLPSVTSAHYQQLIENVKRANMNMLRVWGGGIYEADEFYRLCDENGILVWQDLMFACAMYPGDAKFLDNVKAELQENITRLRNHPSIALWCGNNENSEAWHNWGWQKQFNIREQDSIKIWNWYQALFHQLAPEVIKTYDGQRPYWPTSPAFGWGRNESYTEGDSHYWGVWHGNRDGYDIETIESKTGRFVSEYGMQSLPAWQTVEQFTEPADRDTSSVVMKAHQKNPSGFYKLGSYIDRYFRQPKDFESYAFVTQCLQAYTMKYGIETQRSKMPYCMGTLYWQLNDCWPVASWSTVDVNGKWKASHYAVRNAYEQTLYGVIKKENRYSVFAVNDRYERLSGKLKVTLADFSGNVKWERNVDVSNLPWGRHILFSVDSTELFQHVEPAKAFMQLAALDGSVDDYRTANILYFSRPRDHELEKAAFRIRQVDGSHVAITNDVLCRYVWIDIPGVDFEIDNNYFDMLPGETVTLEIKTQRPLKNVMKFIKVRSLADTYNEVAPAVPAAQ